VGLLLDYQSGRGGGGSMGVGIKGRGVISEFVYLGDVADI
jgi:hypothetical protein